MEGLDDDVIVRRASEDSQSSEVGGAFGEFPLSASLRFRRSPLADSFVFLLLRSHLTDRHLSFARKPSLISTNQSQAFSLPDFNISSLSYSNGNGDDDKLSFASQREQSKRKRIGAVKGVGFWQSRSLASSL